MRTTSHTPEMGWTISFPIESVRHQIIILTLVTHMLLSILVFNTPTTSWNIVRHSHTQHQTMHLILFTLALKRYHLIWFTPNTTPSPTTPIAQVLPLSNSASLACASPTPSISWPTLPPTPQLMTYQLLIPSLLHDGVSKRSRSTAQNLTDSFIYPRSAKRYKTHLSWPHHTRE